MAKNLKKISFKSFIPLLDLLFPLVFIAGWLLQLIRRVGLQRLPLSSKVLKKVGVLPIRHHYYDPLVYEKDLLKPLSVNREIAGLDLNVSEQVELIGQLNYAAELVQLPLEKTASDNQFYYHNQSFMSGDAELLYSMIRYHKPNRIIEIGSGSSTLIARKAILKNQEVDNSYLCNHICIEPYEMPWLEKCGPKIIRERVETCDIGLFEELEKNDILFIDSSHVIRPQGDVLHEYLTILGHLKPGVLVHIHDVFTPRDYLDQWVIKDFRLWNEQYLLEAFLCFNNDFKIICALNYLWHSRRELVATKFPILASEPWREPGSFWITRSV